MAANKYLQAVAKKVWSELSRRKWELGIRLHHNAWRKPRRSDTDGWFVCLGQFTGRIQLQLWFDRFPGLKARHLWFGLYSSDTRTLNRIAARCKVLGAPMEVGWDEIERVSVTNGWRLQTALKPVDFERLMLENYRGKSGFFGKYLMSAGRPKTKPLREVIQKAVDFYEQVANSITRERKIDPDDEVYEGYENRRVVRTHIRERKTKASRQRKKLDGYQCQICSMTFLEVYGDIGRDFAEAHHCVPLSRLRGPTKTQPKDLITVCANCHRMLHRMDGKPDDVARLRRIVRSKGN